MKDLSCSFCGRGKKETGKLISGLDELVFICHDCVTLCGQIFQEHFSDDLGEKKSAGKQMSPLLYQPTDIFAHLDKYIIGQSHAKKVLSVAVYNHLCRNLHFDKFNDVEFPKSNILLIGPTGSGKTLLAKTLSNLLDVPYAIADATSLTEAGYVGDDVENVLKKLLRTADYNIEKASQGIIYIDEVDKIAKKDKGTSITRDVSGEGVQQALLKIIEGTIVSLPTDSSSRKHPKSKTIELDTSRILFIFGGAFVGLEDIVNARVQKKQNMGFSLPKSIKKTKSAEKNNYLESLNTHDLVHFGLIPEFVGRMPVIATLDPLDEKALIDILTQPKNAITKQLQTLFQLHNVKLEFTKQALNRIAKNAMQQGTGARALKSIIENILLDAMFKVPGEKNIEKIVVDAKAVKTKNPVIVYSPLSSEKLNKKRNAA